MSQNNHFQKCKSQIQVALNQIELSMTQQPSWKPQQYGIEISLIPVFGTHLASNFVILIKHTYAPSHKDPRFNVKHKEKEANNKAKSPIKK